MASDGQTPVVVCSWCAVRHTATGLQSLTEASGGCHPVGQCTSYDDALGWFLLAECGCLQFLARVAVTRVGMLHGECIGCCRLAADSCCQGIVPVVRSCVACVVCHTSRLSCGDSVLGVLHCAIVAGCLNPGVMPVLLHTLCGRTAAVPVYISHCDLARSMSGARLSLHSLLRTVSCAAIGRGQHQSNALH